jgi:succinyl-diaminopimelate desuccinylase
MTLLSGSVADVCEALVATPSEYGEEEVLAGHVEERIAELGLAHERLGNAIVARTGVGDGVVLVGHLDTVPNWAGGRASRTEDRIVGRGAADMKGGVAVMLTLAERFAATDEPIVWLFYDREEGPNADNGIHAVLRDSTLLGRPRVGVVLEPTAGTIHLGAVGTMNADVTFRGRGAHSARPWQGVNAISRAVPALTRFAAREPDFVEVEGLEFADVVTVTTAHGGLARNVVPDEFRLAVNVRVAPGRSLDAARAEVESLAGPEAEVEWLDASRSAPPYASAPEVRRFAEASGAAVQPKQAWTDVATLIEWGVPAFNYGPGDPAQAHQTGEFVTIAALESCEAVLERYLRAGGGA